MKLNLVNHPKDYKEKDEVLHVNIKDLGPDVSPGDIIEIYHDNKEVDDPRLLLQIPQMTGDDVSFQKDAISVEQNVANTFHLRPYTQVIVNKVDPRDVALEHVLLTFKDQYLGRSDMWRLKNSLVNTVVYKNKKVEFCSGNIRLQVYEMWSGGTNVACGYITENTKIVFRSSTSMFYLFIQMSSEMWEFDYFGDLYFEKAVNGFLSELFSKWKEKGSNHEVTIVLFSRTYYKATSIEEFPLEESECLQKDYFGRFYEDFYRVAIQNERFDDWTPMLTLLMRHFYDYPNTVLNHHKQPMPEAYISDASEGNFLEVLNISLNVFEKHYLDRSFDRTGQMSVVITPGVGVFQVDRELANITKQRIIDNGVGSDLVCLGEQPLHAVPLFKFHKQRGSVRGDDYSFPHTWINLSFYSSNKKMYYNTFVPRIKVPKELLESSNRGKVCLHSLMANTSDESTALPRSAIDYDNYDAQVFKLPVSQNHNKYNSLQRPIGGRKKTISQSAAQPPPCMLSVERKMSEPDLFHSLESVSESLTQGSHSMFAKSSTINIPTRINEAHASQSFGALNIEGGSAARMSHLDLDELSNKTTAGTSAGSSPCDQPWQPGTNRTSQPRKSLVNPFNPSHMTIKRTSNRRRWTHIFPKDPTGVLIQQHHHTKASTSSHDDLTHSSHDDSPVSVDSDYFDHRISPFRHCNEKINRQNSCPKSNEMEKKKHDTLLWGATGEQQWDAAITTGVDWLSLTLPACLPITTDYFPEEKLNLEYEVASEYGLLPNDANEQLRTYGQKTMTPQQVFHELVSQRLAQGFQLCVDQESIEKDKQQLRTRSSGFHGTSHSGHEEVTEVYRLSIGDVYHKIKLTGSTISVSIYRPRHPHVLLRRRYTYKFQAPDMGQYAVAKAEFYTERPENYKWNHLDNYLCSKGENLENYPLTENLKFWRSRILIVPDTYQSVTKFLMESVGPVHCNTYKKASYVEQQKSIDSFLKFFEAVHRIKRHGGVRRTKDSTNMRERLGSNRIVEHPRVRTDHNQHEANGDHSDSKSSTQSNEHITKEEEKLSTKSTHSELIEAMKDTAKGLSFLNSQYGLPEFSFISADATFWLLEKVDGINTEKDAVQLIEGLVKSGLICHASGKKTHPFVHGFYLYYITTDVKHPRCEVFQSEWHEAAVTVMPPKPLESNSFDMGDVPSYLLQELPNFKVLKDKTIEISSGSALYHSGRLDIDINNKSERYEWGRIKYQDEYSPLRAYEMVVQWLCATGTIVTDLISTWQRRATNCVLHLFPIPCDPFAAPYSYQCNPLRGPIVIQLHASCLKDGEREPFEDFAVETWPYRMFLFQATILEKFGFIPYYTESNVNTVQNQYVHVTGSMFVLVNTPGMAALLNTNKESVYKTSNLSASKEPEYLWVFNHMLTKRWKSTTSGDEILGEKFLQDFKEFCSNKDNRLRNLWDSLLTTVPLSPTDSDPVFDDV